MKIDWLDRLQRFLQTVAFCLAIAALQVAFRPNIRYEGPLVYSLCIGICTWALIDFGRDLFASSRETGWPQGFAALGLPLAGVVGGYLLGTLAADAWFGQSSWSGKELQQLVSSIFITAVAGLVVTYFFYSKGKRAVLEAKIAEAKAHASESKLKLLQTQIEPHMLFNTLANLRALIPIDPTAAVQMLDRMNDYLRATLSASRATMHPLQTEFDRLRDYLELMAVRMGPRLTFTLVLPPHLAAQAVPTLLLQPLVENSIKHGLEPQVEGGSITVSASEAAGVLTLKVADTGAGPDSLRIDKAGSGFGLAQVRERLAAAYGAGATLSLAANVPRGTVVVIVLPLKSGTA